MPTYDYRCSSCGHELDAFQSITEASYTTCPKCGKETLRRLIGTGAGIIFKGSGFYETDYKRKRNSSGSDKKRTGDEAKPGKAEKSPAGKSESAKSE